MISGRATAVLDTNVLLDLWVFADPGAAWLLDEIASGTLQPLRCAGCDTELLDVLRRSPIAERLAAAGGNADALLQRWSSVATLVDGPLRTAGLQCRDPDDQKFLDLAVTGRATMLISKDRALLALARRARAQGLRIATPAAARLLRLQDHAA